MHLCSNGRQTVGDGAFFTDAVPSVLAVCHLEGNDDMYYYSTTFSGGPGVSNIRYFYMQYLLTGPALYSGGFDVPNVKCPPDRGSSDCVTGSRASMFSTSPFTNRSTPSPSPEPKFPNSIVYPPTPPLEPYSTLIDSHFSSATAPQPIPGSRHVPAAHNLATPPLTPDSGADVESISGNDGKRSNDALDFLLTIFPRDGLVALPYAKSVAIAAPNMGATFDGVVLQMPGKPKVLYVDGKTAQSVSLRERCAFSINFLCQLLIFSSL
jgi:hypothetical protein